MAGTLVLTHIVAFMEQILCIFLVFVFFSDVCADLDCHRSNMCYADRTGYTCLCNNGYRLENGNCVGRFRHISFPIFYNNRINHVNQLSRCCSETLIEKSSFFLLYKLNHIRDMHLKCFFMLNHKKIKGI